MNNCVTILGEQSLTLENHVFVPVFVPDIFYSGSPMLQCQRCGIKIEQEFANKLRRQYEMEQLKQESKEKARKMKEEIDKYTYTEPTAQETAEYVGFQNKAMEELIKMASVSMEQQEDFIKYMLFGTTAKSRQTPKPKPVPRERVLLTHQQLVRDILTLKSKKYLNERKGHLSELEYKYLIGVCI